MVDAVITTGLDPRSTSVPSRPDLALGLNNAQWTSVAIVGAVILGRGVPTHRASGV